ncbi:hypothetical protein ACFSHP_14780 [Novosphingobium panipatense]
MALRGWILFQHELDPSIPEVPEVFRFQQAAAALGIEMNVLQPHRFELVVGAVGDWGLSIRAVRSTSPIS